MNFGLSEIVEGTFLRIPIFRQNFEFLNFRPDFLLWRSKSWYFELFLWVFAVFWVSELVVRVSEPILWVSELISLVLGV